MGGAQRYPSRFNMVAYRHNRLSSPSLPGAVSSSPSISRSGGCGYGRNISTSLRARRCFGSRGDFGETPQGRAARWVLQGLYPSYGLLKRHCEERLRRSNPLSQQKEKDGLLRFARNDALRHVDSRHERVGWVERSDTHRASTWSLTAITDYRRLRCREQFLHHRRSRGAAVAVMGGTYRRV